MKTAAGAKDRFSENDLLPLSALQHYLFCPRQCALIHVEQQWAENRFTAEGRVLHERAHEGGSESRGPVRIVRGLRIRSLRLGLIGQADVVEFHQQSTGPPQPYPVEYKRGKPKPHSADEVQLCAQAMCLEEMLSASIPEGALFYGRPRRRHPVIFEADLRQLVEETADALHRLVQAGMTPAARYEKKCDACSLFDICKPKTVAHSKSAQAYWQKMTQP